MDLTMQEVVLALIQIYVMGLCISMGLSALMTVVEMRHGIQYRMHDWVVIVSICLVWPLTLVYIATVMVIEFIDPEGEDQ